MGAGVVHCDFNEYLVCKGPTLFPQFMNIEFLSLLRVGKLDCTLPLD